MEPSSGLRTAYRILRNEGLRALGIHLLEKSFYRRMHFLELPLSPEPIAVPDAGEQQIEFLHPAAVNDYLMLRRQADRGEILERFGQGHRCIIARHEGDIVHACWVGYGRVRIDYLSVEIRLGSDEAYVYDAYTAPEWRGRNLTMLRRAFLSRHMSISGIRKLIAVVVPENRPAVKAVLKGGYRRTGTLACFRLGRWRHVFHIRAPPLR